MNWKTFIVLPLLIVASCGLLPQTVAAKHGAYHAPAHAATSASVTLGASPESITINPGSSGSYFDAQIDYVGTINYNASAANDSYTVSLTEDANNLSYSGAPLKWDVTVDPSSPLDLAVSSSSGDLALNLNDFTLTGFSASTSSGAITANLPATSQRYAAAITSSSGDIKAALEDGAQVNFSRLTTSSGAVTVTTGSGSTLTGAFDTSSGAVTLNGGGNLNLTGSVTTSSGEIHLNFGTGSSAAVNLSTSSGAIVVAVPGDAAVRLEVNENSSGSVTVPATMQRVSGSDKTGAWETSGFAQAEHQIILTVAHDSSGAITIS